MTAAPDLDLICRSALGRPAVAVEPIGAGGNSRVFCVQLDGGAEPARVVVKFYRRDPGDERDRPATEFGGLEFLWQNGIRAIPRPIALVRDGRCAILEYVAGPVATTTAATADDIDESVEFLAALKRLRSAPGNGALGAASEACFSIADVAASVDRRLGRLRASAHGEHAAQLHAWIDGTFAPLIAEVREWSRAAAARCAIAFDEPVGRDARTLSPSDFGLHNAIRRPDATLAFVDFEYFGWDDPAKTIVDFLLHPAMRLGNDLKRRFTTRADAAFADIPALSDRARIVYPLFGLKWAMILLNDFLPERVPLAGADRRRAQLEKAQTLVAAVAAEYAYNPYLS